MATSSAENTEECSGREKERVSLPHTNAPPTPSSVLEPSVKVRVEPWYRDSSARWLETSTLLGGGRSFSRQTGRCQSVGRRSSTAGMPWYQRVSRCKKTGWLLRTGPSPAGKTVPHDVRTHIVRCADSHRRFIYLFIYGESWRNPTVWLFHRRVSTSMKVHILQVIHLLKCKYSYDKTAH